MKRRNIVMLVFISSFLHILILYASASSSNNPVVLVAPFENLSRTKSMISYEVASGSIPNSPKRSFRVDRYSEAPRHVLEDILVNMGVKVVERQRLDAILLETEFGRLSGLVDTAKAVRLGKMLGADTVVMGTITDVRSRREKFSGYGIRTKNEKVMCSLRIRLVDVELGNVRFSSTVQGEETFMSSNFGGVSDSDVAYAVIEAALNKLKDDSTFKKAIMPNGTASIGHEVAVKFTPVPENCNIDIDGIYQGGSPLVVNLSEGQSLRVRISKAGYKTWKTTIVPTSGLVVKPELEKEAR